MMKRFIACSLLTAPTMFLLGKYYQQQKQKEQTIKQQKQMKERSFHREETIIEPFRILEYPNFRIYYSTYHKSPIAVHEYITKKLAVGDAPRAKFFYPDQNILEKHFQMDHSFFTETQAYKRFNFNRGHMAAAGNYSGNQSQKFHTFVYSNVIPQNGYNNGGIWNTFERYSRSLVVDDTCESVEIISGPIYLKNQPKKDENSLQTEKLLVLKQNGVPVPQKLYKIIKCNQDKKSYLNTFVFYNSQTYDNHKSLDEFKVPLEEVERQTGLRFSLKGGELDEVKKDTLKTKKKELDFTFFMGLMSKSQSISEMNENFKRAKEQKIQIDLSVLTPTIRQLSTKQISEIKDSKELECQKLRKLLILNKKIFFLYHLKQTSDIRVQKMQQSYHQCLQRKKTSAQQGTIFKKITDQMGQDLLKLINK